MKLIILTIFSVINYSSGEQRENFPRAERFISKRSKCNSSDRTAKGRGSMEVFSVMVVLIFLMML